MQQFYALFKKEFNGYFQNYFALVIVFIYLLISSGAAFYVSYLDMHDTGLYALFCMQLYIQAALIPALTMKLWSDEYKSGTAEFLLTQPLKYRQPVLAKIGAAFAFGVFLSLLLLPFIHETAQMISLDWGNITCAYIGLWLIIFVFCAVGSLISALNKNMIAVYLLSLFTTAFLTLVPATHFRAAFNDFLLAEVGIGDLLYFLAIGVTVVFLNILVLQLRASAQKYKLPRFILFGIMMLASVSVLCFAAYTVFPNKFDMTAQRIYTPQKSSRQIVSALPEPLTIDVYIAKDYLRHSTEYTRYYQQVVRFLKKYEKLSNKKIKVTTMEVEPFSQLENAVVASGLYYEENIYGSKDYFGAVIKNPGNEGVAIKHFLAARSPYLEKDIGAAVLKLSRDDVMKSIGVYLDPLQNLEDFHGFMLNLENDYNVVNLTSNVYSISPKLDLLLLINPKDVPLAFRDAVEKYIADGGNVVLLFDFYTENQSDDINLQYFSLIHVISKWGIAFSGEMVDDGKPAPEFAPSGLPVTLFKAVDFDMENENLTVTPLITHNEHLVGALLQGKFPSLHLSAEAAARVKPAQVAAFGDVDLIIDDNWIAAQSPDKNPYDVVAKASNVEILRNLIDRMVNNTVYLSLPVRYTQHNTFSISEKIYNRLYQQNAPTYFDLSAELIDARASLDAGIPQNPDKIMQMLESGEAGQKISELELQTESILYNMVAQYKSEVRLLFISQVIVLPLFISLLLFLLIFVIRRKHQKAIREFMNE